MLTQSVMLCVSDLPRPSQSGVGGDTSGTAGGRPHGAWSISHHRGVLWWNVSGDLSVSLVMIPIMIMITLMIVVTLKGTI